MKKLLKILFLTLVIILILAIVAMFTPLAGTSIKKGIEHFGSKALQTKVTVESVNLNVAKGHLALKNFRIANLERFDNPYAFKMDNIDVSVNLKSLLSDVIVVNSIKVDAPVIFAENFGENLKALQKNVEASSKKEEFERTAPEEAEKSEKKMIIKDFQLNDARLVLGDNLTLPLPNIHLENLGTADNAITPAEMTAEIMSAIVQNTAQAIADTGKKAINSLIDRLF